MTDAPTFRMAAKTIGQHQAPISAGKASAREPTAARKWRNDIGEASWTLSCSSTRAHEGSSWARPLTNTRASGAPVQMGAAAGCGGPQLPSAQPSSKGSARAGIPGQPVCQLGARRSRDYGVQGLETVSRG
mmetsp:Transcript_22115/g.75843  ORF Transcript_22115/g.75843 Transcript_22115/m.75843 type:complete len:131 (-) Transcript_22115:32-424(-)